LRSLGAQFGLKNIQGKADESGGRVTPSGPALHNNQGREGGNHADHSFAVVDSTDEHSASNDGIPVLANRGTGEAYGPGDTVRAYPSQDLVPAARVVDRLLGGKKQELTEEEKVFVRAFFLN
jgi:hypothetical protein